MKVEQNFSDLVGNPTICARVRDFKIQEGLTWKKLGTIGSGPGNEHEFEAAYTPEYAYVRAYSGGPKGSHYYSFILDLTAASKNYPIVVQGIDEGVEPNKLEEFLDRFYVTLSPEDVEKILTEMSVAASKHGKSNRELDDILKV